ncbi:MAG: hypothetical protein KAR40_12130 [Candidatus Sabulitectum sp.]|nr:hypothetical protein [Candidatus Sabulitectum sp.]
MGSNPTSSARRRKPRGNGTPGALDGRECPLCGIDFRRGPLLQNPLLFLQSVQSVYAASSRLDDVISSR